MVKQYTSSFTLKQDRAKKNAGSSVVIKMQPLSFVGVSFCIDNSDHHLFQPLHHTKVRISVMFKAAILETISSKTYFVISFVHRVVNLDGGGKTLIPKLILPKVIHTNYLKTKENNPFHYQRELKLVNI